MHDDVRRGHNYYYLLIDGYNTKLYTKHDRGVKTREVILTRSRLKARASAVAPQFFFPAVQDPKWHVLVYENPVLVVMSRPRGEARGQRHPLLVAQLQGEPQHKALSWEEPGELEVSKTQGKCPYTTTMMHW
ncbi:hypothetical protein GQ600_4601 [Phytophthora cactorum]|nr:hypothetical protein GQ600_4601 [Phytophthora cactorum]